MRQTTNWRCKNGNEINSQGSRRDRRTARKILKEWALTKSQLAGMAIQAGMGGILRAVKPEESIPPEMWAKITKEIEKLEQKTGKDLE